jgi:hypothetical protein
MEQNIEKNFLKEIRESLMMSKLNSPEKPTFHPLPSHE